MTKPKLSILICTVVGREEKFDKLYNELFLQSNNEVEILFEKDNKQISVGAKRQKLLERATGKFIVFIDDDDWISENYIKNILNVINSEYNLDCIGFKIECKGTKGVTAAASNKYSVWADNYDGYDYVRTIYHKNPVRRTHAALVGFKDMRFGEDHDYSVRLKASGFLQNEIFIDEVMYYYNFTYENPETKYGK